MSDAFLILTHASMGVFAGFLFVFVFADVLHATEENLKRIRYLGTLGAVLAFIGLYFGLDFYLNSYGPDKAIIKSGTWDWAHAFFTETKEHVLVLGIFILIMLLIMLWTLEPQNDPAAKKLLLWTLITLAVGVLFLEGWGAIMAYGLRVGLGGA